jgi:hypothetical protein
MSSTESRRTSKGVSHWNAKGRMLVRRKLALGCHLYWYEMIDKGPLKKMVNGSRNTLGVTSTRPLDNGKLVSHKLDVCMTGN